MDWPDWPYYETWTNIDDAHLIISQVQRLRQPTTPIENIYFMRKWKEDISIEITPTPTTPDYALKLKLADQY